MTWSKYRSLSAIQRFAITVAVLLSLMDFAFGATTYLGAPPPPAVKRYMEALFKNYPDAVEVEVGEAAPGGDESRNYVVVYAVHDVAAYGTHALVLNVNHGMATSKSWLKFTLHTATKCGDSKSAPCVLELSTLPSVEAKESSIMIRSRFGCGVARWDSSESYGELVDCSVTPHDYVMKWTECRVAGGNTKAVGLYGFSECVRRSQDAGEACTDNSQCQFGCRLWDVGRGESQPATGRCAPNDSLVGCWTELKDGKESSHMCVD
jgi:hypothetical protein